MFRRLDVALSKLFSDVLKNSPWGQRPDGSFFWINKKMVNAYGFFFFLFLFFSKDSDVFSQVAMRFYF